MHLVINLDPTVSLTHNYVDPHSLDMVFAELRRQVNDEDAEQEISIAYSFLKAYSAVS